MAGTLTARASSGSRPGLARRALVVALEPWFYLSPALVILVAVLLVPLVIGIAYSFRRFGAFRSEFVGLGQYRHMLTAQNTDKEVKEYVKERFRSALQLMRNIAQRKSTILRTCEVIVRRQQDFLEQGVESLHPMMIKEVAEEIGVHPSTVSRAVANKYAHTPQGVIELRSFFSEAVNGPEGGGMSLLTLKRLVKKMIDEEDASKPLTDDQIAKKLEEAGIQVTRRTVAKYREDMRIPSTHQRRVKA